MSKFIDDADDFEFGKIVPRPFEAVTVGQVWFVRGDGDTRLFDSKESAERWARECFPGESAEQRYARVYYREVLKIT